MQIVSEAKDSVSHDTATSIFIASLAMRPADLFIQLFLNK